MLVNIEYYDLLFLLSRKKFYNTICKHSSCKILKNISLNNILLKGDKW